MKKIILSLLAIAAICVACGNGPEQTDEPFKMFCAGAELASDTTITVNTITSDLFGDYMECTGLIQGEGTINVEITRSIEGIEDELCVNMCAAGNGEKKEIKEYSISGESEWYAHYYPKTSDMCTISYRFYNSAKSLTVTINFDASEYNK